MRHHTNYMTDCQVADEIMLSGTLTPERHLLSKVGVAIFRHLEQYGMIRLPVWKYMMEVLNFRNSGSGALLIKSMNETDGAFDRAIGGDAIILTINDADLLDKIIVNLQTHNVIVSII